MLLKVLWPALIKALFSGNVIYRKDIRSLTHSEAGQQEPLAHRLKCATLTQAYLSLLANWLEINYLLQGSNPRCEKDRLRL